MNRSNWPNVTLAEVLSRNETTVMIEPDQQYQEVTVRLWGKGVTSRGFVSGTDIASNRRFKVSVGQFIVSRIDARNGAMGIIPVELDGAIVTNDFPTFNTRETRMNPEYFGWFSQTKGFVEMCRSASEGTTNRVRLKEERFMRLEIPLPPLEVQKRIVDRIGKITRMAGTAGALSKQVRAEYTSYLRSEFSRATANAPRVKLSNIATLARRAVIPKPSEEYAELGVRSFGKGTFHKPTVDYMSIGTKKLYRIEPGDLVFNNVFAWEGAIAVAKPEDEGRVGSHRFITYIPDSNRSIADFLCFYFLTPEGLELIGEASPGGAGRNRTLGLDKLAEIKVPCPCIDTQRAFVDVLQKVMHALELRDALQLNVDALLPSVLDRAFKGEL